MGKFDGILMCTDLDGTLMKRDKSVSKENLDAIEYFKSEGGSFTFITGRMPYNAVPTYELVKPNVPIGAANGGAVYDIEKKEYVWIYPIKRDVLELVEYIDKRIEGIGVQVVDYDNIYFVKDNEAMERFRKLTGAPRLTADLYGVEGELSKILFADMDDKRIELVADLLDKHPRANEFEFIRSERTLYEILPKGVNKGLGLTKICELLGFDKDRTIAFGDYNNDVEMLRTARLGVAVANAHPDAKAAADYVTVSNEEHAIARVIYELDEGKFDI